ncbi:opsin-5-like isoform X2 [Portunus trituberculatus]|uniref:opsin-5-like isoform X2 n=1 Tax=Portunus trituberculatus TaxID=210409 RepID=UPI001E1CFCE1|nr:opsin-5-like isoform X2 [Portunus trituberculatus]
MNKMTQDGVAAAVAAVHSPISTPPAAGPSPAMASLPTDLPGACNVTYSDKFDSRLVWYEDHIVGGFLILVGITSLLGNGTTIVMFYRKLRHLTAAEVLLLNMAVMHLCLAIFSYPCPTISSFAHRWLFGNVGCQIYGFVCYTLGIATIVSMVALAVVRYLKTCTHTYSRRLTAQHMKVVLLAVYFYSLFWSILPFLSLGKAYEVEPFGTSCTLHWASDEKATQVYILVVVVMVVVAPFMVMFWCYLEILLMVRRNHRKKMYMAKRSGNSQGRTELQLTLVSALVCLGYLVAWLPYTVVSVSYALLKREAPVYFALAPVLLAKSSCAYNPIVYVFVNARYRQQMREILCETLQTLLCWRTSPQVNTEAQAADTSQDINSSRTLGMNQESMLMEEVQPLTNTAAASIKSLNSTQATTPCHLPPEPSPSSQKSLEEEQQEAQQETQKEERKEETEEAVLSQGMPTPEQDAPTPHEKSPTLSSNVFHSLYGFQEGGERCRECEEASCNHYQQQSKEGRKEQPTSASVHSERKD